MISGYFITVSSMIGIFMILAMSLNIITGYAGQISIGHAAFFGIGAYSSALLSVKAGLPFWISLPLAVAITACVGALLGIPCLRVKDDFLAIITMGINFVVEAVFLYIPFFGGAMGLGNIPFPKIFSYEFSKFHFLLMVIFFILICIMIDRLLIRSWAGMALEAIREDETAASTSGVDVTKFKVYAFTIGSGLAGLGGSLYAHFMSFISPYDFGFPQSIAILSMVVFGGIGVLRGPIIGAILLGAAPEIFRPIMEYRTLIYGGLLIFMMRFQPSGLLGEGGLIIQLFSRRIHHGSP
jgi:branched-chain amino acid transport system permease protein